MTFDTALNPQIILASGSPRRKELLASLGVSFEVILPPVDEKAFDLGHLSPAEKVCFLAQAKAESVAKQLAETANPANPSLVIGSDTHADNNEPVRLIIGSDTIVVFEETVFEKPENTDDAFRMLKALQGNTHQVYSGIAVLRVENRQISQSVCEASMTEVTFLPMHDEAIQAYIQTGEPMDKAGAYAIQGLGSLNIERINGCYFNVVGMSLPLLAKITRQIGFELTN